jgi:hypothetical protein
VGDTGGVSATTSSIEFVQQCLQAGVVPTMDMLRTLQLAAGENEISAPTGTGAATQEAVSAIQAALLDVSDSESEGAGTIDGAEEVSTHPVRLDCTGNANTKVAHEAQSRVQVVDLTGNHESDTATDNGFFEVVEVGLGLSAGGSAPPPCDSSAEEGMFIAPQQCLGPLLSDADSDGEHDYDTSESLLQKLEDFDEADMQELLDILGDNGLADDANSLATKESETTDPQQRVLKQMSILLDRGLAGASSTGMDIASRVRKILDRRASSIQVAQTGKTHKLVKAAVLGRAKKGGRSVSKLSELVCTVSSALEKATSTQARAPKCTPHAAFMSLLLVINDHNCQQKGAPIHLLGTGIDVSIVR